MVEAYRSATDDDDLGLLYAGVEIQAWFVAIEARIKGEPFELQPLDPLECRFGLRLNSASSERYGKHPAFHDIENLHRKLHALATSLLDLQACGQPQQALAGLDEFHQQRDALQQKLQSLLRNDLN